MTTTEAQLAANRANAALSTGPLTETGKSRSSKNALTFGLFTMTDFIRENESDEYTNLCSSLWNDLTPEGALEQTFTTEIMSVTWRLRRCRMVEEDLAEISIVDPMQDPATARQQRSVDRARAQSHNILRRCLAELRKLQTERGVRSQAFPDSGPPEGLGLMDVRALAKVKPIEQNPEPAQTEPSGINVNSLDALMALADKQLCQQYRDYGIAGFTHPSVPAAAPTAAPEVASFCKPAPAAPAAPQNAPRNAPCPCGSGMKFKRCCGNPAASAPGKAA